MRTSDSQNKKPASPLGWVKSLLHDRGRGALRLPSGGSIRLIPLRRLELSSFSIRHGEAVQDAEDLALSIQKNGLQSPLLVRPHPKRSGYYEVAAGARRLHALQLAGVKEAPCLVRSMTDLEVLMASFLENDQRIEMDPITKARALKRMLLWRPEGEVENPFPTQKALGEALGRSAQWVNQHLRLLRLNPEVQEWVRTREVCWDAALRLADGYPEEAEHRTIGYAVRGHRRGVQVHMMDIIRKDPGLVSLSRKQLRDALVGLVSSYTPHERFELRKLYKQCGLDPDSIQWSTLTRPEYEREVRAKQTYLAKRLLRQDMPLLKPARQMEKGVERLVHTLDDVTLVVSIDEELHAVSVKELKLGGIATMGLKYEVARHLHKQGALHPATR